MVNHVLKSTHLCNLCQYNYQCRKVLFDVLHRALRYESGLTTPHVVQLYIEYAELTRFVDRTYKTVMTTIFSLMDHALFVRRDKMLLATHYLRLAFYLQSLPHRDEMSWWETIETPPIDRDTLHSKEFVDALKPAIDQVPIKDRLPLHAQCSICHCRGRPSRPLGKDTKLGMRGIGLPGDISEILAPEPELIYRKELFKVQLEHWYL